MRNQSDRFEARFSLVEVTQSPSLLLQGMVGSMMPIAVSHGEGQVEVRDGAHLAQLESKGLVALRFVDNFGKVTESYPAQPEWFAERYHCGNQRKRARDHHDAAPGTRVPHRVELLAPGKLGRRQPVDAYFPQRA